MTKNVTIRFDEAILKQCRHAAVEEEKSLSRWISDVLVKTVSEKNEFLKVKERALLRLEKGFHLGGRPLSRKDIYER